MEENQILEDQSISDSTPQEDLSSHDTDSVVNEPQQENIGQSEQASGEDEITRMKREYGKLQQVQKEMQKLQSQYGTVSNWIMRDPVTYKKALMETSNYTEYEADQIVRQQHPNWQGSFTTQNTGQAQSPMVRQPAFTPDPVKQLAAQELLAEKEAKIRSRQDSIRDFINEHTELSNEEHNLIFQAAGMIERNSKGSMTPKEAIELAYKRNFKPELLLKEAEETGELKGLSQASSIASSISTPPKGSITKSVKEPYVPEDEWSMAQSMGFKSKSEYALYRDNSRLIVG